MFELILTLLLVLCMCSMRYIAMFFGIIFGDKELCNEFVDQCVPLQEQWREQWKADAIRFPQDISNDKGQKKGTSANLPGSPPHN